MIRRPPKSTQSRSSAASDVYKRPGGYTRILKTGNRLGDNADMCMMELVDYNDAMLEARESKSKAKTGSKRTRRGKKTDAAAAAPEKAVEVEKVEEPKSETKSESSAEAESNDSD